MDASRLQVTIGMFLFLSMLAIGWTPPAAADTYTNVSATAMWFGGGSWPDHPVIAPDGNFETGLGADEIFNATFQWDVTTQMLVAGSVHTSFTGPIGPFLSAQILPWFANFNDASGDYVQFFAQDFSAVTGQSQFGVPGVYNFCGNCDGVYLGFPGAAGPFGFRTGVNSLVVTPAEGPVATPEPGSAFLLGLGFLGLNFVMRNGRPGAFSRRSTLKL